MCACSQWDMCEGEIACQNVCILCLEAPVVREPFRFSPRLISRPFRHPTGCLLVSLSLTTVLYLQACVSTIQPLVPFIYRLMTVAVLSIHLYQPDDDHRCPHDPGYTPRLNRGQELWSLPPIYDPNSVNLTTHRHKHGGYCAKAGKVNKMKQAKVCFGFWRTEVMIVFQAKAGYRAAWGISLTPRALTIP